MVRISDARMSRTAYGTVVLHVAPESAAGGPLALVRNGDPIVLDVPARRIELDVPTEELSRRAGSPTAQAAYAAPASGWGSTRTCSTCCRPIEVPISTSSLVGEGIGSAANRTDGPRVARVATSYGVLGRL
jgi:hypothetical protein